MLALFMKQFIKTSKFDQRWIAWLENNPGSSCSVNLISWSQEVNFKNWQCCSTKQQSSTLWRTEGHEEEMMNSKLLEACWVWQKVKDEDRNKMMDDRILKLKSFFRISWMTKPEGYISWNCHWNKEKNSSYKKSRNSKTDMVMFSSRINKKYYL